MTPLEKPINALSNLILATIQNAFKKCSPPTMELDSVMDINMQLLKKLKSEYGIGGLIVDVDETLRANGKDIPQCNQKWLENIKEEFKICVVSKGYDERVKQTLNQMGIEYDGMHLISKRKSFKETAEKMGLSPKEVLIVGDDAISDIYAGNKCGMITAMVKQVVEEKDEMER